MRKKNSFLFPVLGFIILSGTIIWYFNNRHDEAFWSQVQTAYDQAIKNRLMLRINRGAGPDAQGYEAQFSAINEVEKSKLNNFLYQDFSADTITSPQVRLEYEGGQKIIETRPLMQVFANNQWQTYIYTDEPGAQEVLLNPWTLETNDNAIQPKFLQNLEELVIDKSLRKTQVTDQEVIFVRSTENVVPGTGAEIRERYFFHPRSYQLLKKEDEVTYKGRPFVIRETTYEILPPSGDEEMDFVMNETFISITGHQRIYTDETNGLDYFFSFVYDKQIRRVLTIEDVIVDFEALSTYTRENIQSQFNNAPEELINARTMPEPNNFAQFSLATDNRRITGLNIYIPNAHFIPEDQGRITIFIPTEDLIPLLTEEYKPFFR